MRNFLLKILKFSILPILLVTVIDCLLRNIPNSGSVKYNGALNRKDIQVLCFGNSHANYAIDPCSFQDFKVYNLSNVAQTLYYDNYIFQSWLKDGIHEDLMYVLVSVDYHSLFTISQGEKRDLLSFYNFGVEPINKRLVLERISPSLFGFKPKFSSELLHDFLERSFLDRTNHLPFSVEPGVSEFDTLCNGFIAREGQDLTKFRSTVLLARLEHFNVQFLESNQLRARSDLNTFIESIRASGAKPILFSSPTFSEYNSLMDTNVINYNSAVIESICRQ